MTYSNPLDKILDMDGIDQVNKNALRDIYMIDRVFNRWRKQYIRNVGKTGRNPLMTEKFKRVKKRTIEKGTLGLLKEVGTKEYKEIAEKEENPLKKIFDEYTKDSMSDKEKFENIKKLIKHKYKGCCGMPSVEIIRERIKQYNSN